MTTTRALTMEIHTTPVTTPTPELRLYNIARRDSFGYGGGTSFLVKARSREHAEDVVADIDLKDAYAMEHEIYKSWDVPELSEGEFIVLSYWE